MQVRISSELVGKREASSKVYARTYSNGKPWGMTSKKFRIHSMAVRITTRVEGVPHVQRTHSLSTRTVLVPAAKLA